MKDLLDALFVKAFVPTIGYEVLQQFLRIDGAAFIADQNACKVGLSRYGAQRAKNGGRIGLCDFLRGV